MRTLRPFQTSAALVAFVVALLGATDARAGDSTIRNPGDHPSYKVEIEPHGLFGWDYGADGYGAGLRVGIPIVENGFIPSINNSVAISFGADFVHYNTCWFAGFGCSTNALLFPVAMQWNFYVAQKWSVFGEPGIYFANRFYDSSFCTRLPNGTTCATPNSFYVAPALYLGGRYYFSEHVALTMRVGYPTFSVGVSFM